MAAAVAISAARRDQTDRQHRAEEDREADRDEGGGFFGRESSSRRNRGDSEDRGFAARREHDDSQQHIIARQMMASQLRRNPELISQVKDPEARKHLEEARSFTSKAKAITAAPDNSPDISLPPTEDDLDHDPDYALTAEQRAMVSRGGRMQAWREDMTPEQQAKLDLALKGQLPGAKQPPRAEGSRSSASRKRRSSAADALLLASRGASEAGGASVLSQGALRSQTTGGGGSKSTRSVMADSKVGPSGSRRYSKAFSKRQQSTRAGGGDDDPGVVQRGGQVQFLEGYEEQPCVIPQNHPFVRGWDLVMLALLIFTAVVTPFEVAFLPSTSYDAMFFVNVVVSLCFLCDLGINFFLPYTDLKTGIEVDDNIDIAYNYLTGWFTLDFLSIFPFDVIAAETGGAESASRLRIIRTIRLLKLAKLLRIVRANRIFTRWRNMIGLTYSMVQLLQFLVVIMVLAHWSACVFYLWSSLFMDDYETSFIQDAGLDESKPWTGYLVSLYWATATISTIGYGDVNPVNTAERGMGVLLMLIGGGLYAYTVGAVYGLISTYDGATIEYRRMLDNLNMYTKEYKLPPDLKQDLRDYFGHCQKLMRAQFYRDLLRQMSPELRGRVASYLHKPWISHIPFFNVDKPSENKAFITAVAMNLEAAVFARKEHVVRQNETLTKMVIIQKGLATRWDTGQIVRRGAFFGEEMIMSRAQSHTTYQAVTFLDVYFLTKKSLQRILESGDFEKTRQKIRFAIIRLALRRELKLAIAFIRMQNNMLGIAPQVANVPGATTAIERKGSKGSMDSSNEHGGDAKGAGPPGVAMPSESSVGIRTFSEVSESQADGTAAKLITSKSIREAAEQREEEEETMMMPALAGYLVTKGLVNEEFVAMKRRHSVAATSKVWRRNSKDSTDPERKKAKERAREAAEREARANPAYRELLEASTPVGGSSPARSAKRHGSMIMHTRDPLLPGIAHEADVEAQRARQRWAEEQGGAASGGPSSVRMGSDGRAILSKAKSHHKVPFSHQVSPMGPGGRSRRRSGASRLVHKMHTAAEESREEDASPRKQPLYQRQAAAHEGSVLERGAYRDSDSDDDRDSTIPGGLGQPRQRKQRAEPMSLGLRMKEPHTNQPVVPGRAKPTIQAVDLPGTPAGIIARADDSPAAANGAGLRRVPTGGTSIHPFDEARDVGGGVEVALEPLGGRSVPGTTDAIQRRSQRERRRSAPGIPGEPGDVAAGTAPPHSSAESSKSGGRSGLRVVATGIPDSDSDADGPSSDQTGQGVSMSIGGEHLEGGSSNPRDERSISGQPVVAIAGTELESKWANASDDGSTPPQPVTASNRSSRPAKMAVQAKPRGGRRMSRAGLIEADKQAALKRTRSTGHVLASKGDDPKAVRRAFNTIKRKMNPLAREMWRNQLIKQYGMDPDDASRVVEDPSQRELVVYTKEGRRVVLDPKEMGGHGPVQGGFRAGAPVVSTHGYGPPGASQVQSSHPAAGGGGFAVPRHSKSSSFGTVQEYRDSDVSGHVTARGEVARVGGSSAIVQLSPAMAAKGVQERFAVVASDQASKELSDLASVTRSMEERLRNLANANASLNRQQAKMEQEVSKASAMVERNHLQMQQMLYRMWTGMIGMCVVAALIVSIATASLVVVLNTAR